MTLQHKILWKTAKSKQIWLNNKSYILKQINILLRFMLNIIFKNRIEFF